MVASVRPPHRVRAARRSAPGLVLALGLALGSAASQAAVPDPKTRDALDALVMGQLAAKACHNLRINFSAMTDVAAAAGLRAADATRLYGQTMGELGQQYSREAGDDLATFCAKAMARLGPEGTRAHMLERTDTAR